MTPGDSDSRPAADGTGHQIAENDAVDGTAQQAKHGSEFAVEHVSMLNVWEWKYRVTEEVRAGNLARADVLQERYSLPDLGNATGAVFRELHHDGVIRPAYYDRSTKPSRSGGIITVWRAGDAA